MFLVDVEIQAGNRIVVEIDSMTGIDIDSCAALSRAIEEKLNRDEEDFELEVGSAGITSPFKVHQQYVKNLNQEVEVLTRSGRKLTGTLREVGDETITLEMAVKVRPEGKKKPIIELVPEVIPYSDIKTAKYVINFK